MTRGARFVTIGSAGFLLQLSALWLLTAGAHWTWMPATCVAVELAIIHNFLWHVRWTWHDRHGTWLARFVKFQLATGATSLGGNAALMVLFSGALGWPPLAANAAAVALLSLLNFVAADRWVFRLPGVRGVEILLCLAAMMIPVRARAQGPEALTAWDRYVSMTEGRLERSRTSPRTLRSADDTIAADGETVRVPSGTISDWHGAVMIHGITLDDLLRGLMHPGTPPPQEDVVASHVLARTGDSLRVSIRLVRRAIVTVTYDTEHEMRFRRWSPTLATATSVATRIEEVGGNDHGFLWRLRSYWRYEALDDGVRVELESLTLSRDVPTIVRPIAAPLMTRIARESMCRTLEALRRSYTR
jgi:putative flippase GtrA